MAKIEVKHGSYAFEDRERNKGRKKIVSAAIMALFFVFAALGATQYLASVFGYAQSLGKGYMQVSTVRIYQPFAYTLWLKTLLGRYGSQNVAVQKYLMICTAIQILGTFLPLMIIKGREKALRNRRKIEKLHGSARWAEKEDIIESTLLPRPGESGQGVYVGGWADKRSKKTLYLRHNGAEHILAYAPTRSGKGVGLVIPTLLNWQHSIFVLDIKGENYALTAGWRKEHAGNYILKFDPLDTSGNSARYNPLNEIRMGTVYEHADIENLAMLLADPTGHGSEGSQKHWIETSGSLIVGLIYHMLYKAKLEGYEPTLERLRFLFANAETSFDKTLEEILGFNHDPKGFYNWKTMDGKPTKTHPIAASNAREALQRDEREAASVLSTAANTTKLFADPAIAFNLKNATFRLTDLMNADKPVSLYICVPPAQLTRLVPLVRILLTQIVTILADHLRFEKGQAKGDYIHKMLLMLDEFPTLGNMEIFETSLAFIAGYGLKSYIIVQDLKQLYKRYTDKESIVSNTHVQIAYAPNNLETAKTLSDILGTTTVIKEVRSTSMTKGVTTYNTSTQEQQRALLTPQEVMTLKGPLKDSNGMIQEPGDMIVKVSGFPPILGRQILYFKDPTFQRRSEIPAPEKSDVLYCDGNVAYTPPNKPWEGKKQDQDVNRLMIERLRQSLDPGDLASVNEGNEDNEQVAVVVSEDEKTDSVNVDVNQGLQEFYGDAYDEFEDDDDDDDNNEMDSETLEDDELDRRIKKAI